MSVNNNLNLSPLPHTWILDLDGTLLEHNGYKTGEDKWLPGALDFLHSIPPDDYILILTARFEEWSFEKTKEFLHKHHVRYNQILFGMPQGERILINDTKPSGLLCAYGICVERNQGLEHIKININKDL